MAEHQVDIGSNSNHFYEEKVKERRPPGIDGSLLVLYAFFFAVFALGFLNINRCPLNQLIPIYLICTGLLGALAKFLSKYDENKYCFWATSVLVLFDVVWQGVGTFVVYREYQPTYEPTVNSTIYCNRTAYLVAFWTLTIEYTLLMFFMLLSCCYLLMRRDFRTESGTK